MAGTDCLGVGHFGCYGQGRKRHEPPAPSLLSLAVSNASGTFRSSLPQRGVAVVLLTSRGEADRFPMEARTKPGCPSSEGVERL